MALSGLLTCSIDISLALCRFEFPLPCLLGPCVLLLEDFLPIRHTVTSVSGSIQSCCAGN